MTATQTATSVNAPSLEPAWAVLITSPSDPRVEYIPAPRRHQRSCRCPYTVLDDGLRSWQMKVLHVAGCTRRAIDAATQERLPVGVLRCPECGDVRYSLRDAQRQCWACGHCWRPA